MGDANSKESDYKIEPFYANAKQQIGAIEYQEGELGEYENHSCRDIDLPRAVSKQLGSITSTADHFDISATVARNWLIRYESYDLYREGLPGLSERLETLSPTNLGLSSLGERR